MQYITTEDIIPIDKLKNLDFLCLKFNINIEPIEAIIDANIGNNYNLYK